jgi:TPR repeat protein
LHYVFIYFYELSAHQGFARVQFNYGVMLENGEGIPMDESLAANYFKLSADQGFAKYQ